MCEADESAVDVQVHELEACRAGLLQEFSPIGVPPWREAISP